MAGFKISNDVGATVFVILSGLSALFLTAWIFGSGGCRDTNRPKIAPIHEAQVATEDSGEIAAIRTALAEESARRSELAAELRKSQSGLSSLTKENATLTAQLKQLESEVTLKRDLDKKLANLQIKLKAANDDNDELTTRVEAANSSQAKLEAVIADLQAKLKALEVEKNAIAAKLKASGDEASKMAGLNAELVALKLKFDAESKASKEATSSLHTLKQAAAEKEKSLLAQIESLKGAMAGDSKKIAAELKALQLSSAAKEKKTAAGLDALKLSFADKEKIAAARLVKLNAEVDALTKKLTTDAKACDDAKKKLVIEINKLNGDLDALKNGQKLKRAADLPDLDYPLLVNDPAKLDAKMRPLFASLRGIKETAADREATYKTITLEDKSIAIDVVQFASGSALVKPEETKELEAKLKDLGKDVKVLAVGYASMDGDAKTNHALSSQRASNVAQEVARITGLKTGDVQAVYFGQTSRFDENSLTPNRIVEVWVTR